MEQTIELADKEFEGLCFVNLVDFDAKWGHRRNPQGYRDELEKFERIIMPVACALKLPFLLPHIGSGDDASDFPFRRRSKRSAFRICRRWGWGI